MDAARINAVEKLNKGATNGIKGVVKGKVLDNKYSTLCREKLAAHLKAIRVDVADVFRVATPVLSARHICAAKVSVGDFVEVDADRSPGWNSEGGIAWSLL